MADEVVTQGRAMVDEKGRLTLPAPVLDLLEVRAGSWIPWRFEDGELRLMNRAAGLRFAHAMVAELAKKHPGSWADELIEKQALETARLRLLTRSLGLSLSDRACLALARMLRLPTVTTDRVWAGLHIGVEVKVIR